MTSPNPLPYSYSTFLSSDMFTLLAGPSLKPFCVHKQLLAEVSTELKSHVYNGMKEGLEGSMKMTHVSEETMSQFLEFCYTGSYPDNIGSVGGGGEGMGTKGVTGGMVPHVEPHIPSKPSKPSRPLGVPGRKRLPEESSNTLHANAKLYVFGDMYNIPRLKDLAFEKITKAIQDIGSIESGQHEVVKDYINLFRYALDNLPEITKDGSDPLLECLGNLAAWGLNAFRENMDFILLFSESGRVDFTRIVLGNVSGSRNAPWVKKSKASNTPPAAPPKYYHYDED